MSPRFPPDLFIKPALWANHHQLHHVQRRRRLVFPLSLLDSDCLLTKTRRSGADRGSSEQQKLQATTESTATTQTRFTPSIFCPTPLFSARCCRWLRDFAAAVASTRIAPGDSALGVVASSMARPLLQEGYKIRWHYLLSLLLN